MYFQSCYKVYNVELFVTELLDYLKDLSPSSKVYLSARLSQASVTIFCRGGSRISGKGVHMYKGVGARFADFIAFFLNMP